MTKLKRAFFIIVFLLLGNILIAGYPGAKASDPSPQAIIEKTTFEFSPIIAGTEVSHCFAISNKGNAPLNIPGVQTG